MMLPLSDRLLACCALVAPGDRVADVGCDHGYLGIHLLQSGVACSVIEADINRGPLQSARNNAAKFGVKERMTFCLSDGVRSIPRDFDTLVCAGMGADTMISILDEAPWVKDARYRLILQCQSRTPVLRQYLYSRGFAIRRETLAQDGKFIYPVMEAVYDPGSALTPGECYISPALLRSGSPLLPAFLSRVIASVESTVHGLSRGGGEKYQEFRSILAELKEMEAQVHANGC